MKYWDAEDWIVHGIIALFVFIVGFLVYFFATHDCIKSHVETQYEQAPSVIVGGGKDGGGIAIPIGNMRPVQVTVCDEYN